MNKIKYVLLLALTITTYSCQKDKEFYQPKCDCGIVTNVTTQPIGAFSVIKFFTIKASCGKVRTFTLGEIYDHLGRAWNVTDVGSRVCLPEELW